MTDNGFPCMRCQRGTVVHKSPLILECQTCFASMPTPQQPEHDAANEVDDAPLLQPAGAMAGPIQLTGYYFYAKEPIHGGNCSQCGQFFAWQANHIALECPSCKTKYWAAPINKLGVFFFASAFAPLVLTPFLALGVYLTVKYGLSAGTVLLLFIGAMPLVNIVASVYTVYTHSQLPAIGDHRLLTSEELARLSPSSSFSC